MSNHPVRYCAALFCAVSLGGCAGSPIANEKNARLNYEQSVDEYRACLRTNETNVRACDGKRLLMETEERHWANLSGDLNERLRGGAVNRSTVTIQGR